MKTERSRRVNRGTPGQFDGKHLRYGSGRLRVRPVARMAKASNANAVIPIDVISRRGTPESLIPAKVALPGKKVQKRAAVIPVAVRTRRPRAPRFHLQGTTSSNICVGEFFIERLPRTYPVPWRTLLDDIVLGVIAIEFDGVNLLVEYGRTLNAALRFLLWPFASGGELYKSSRHESREMVRTATRRQAAA